MKVGIVREYSSTDKVEEDECVVMLGKAELVAGEIRISGSGERDPTSKHDGYALTGYVMLHPSEFQKGGRYGACSWRDHDKCCG